MIKAEFKFVDEDDVSEIEFSSLEELVIFSRNDRVEWYYVPDYNTAVQTYEYIEEHCACGNDGEC